MNDTPKQVDDTPCAMPDSRIEAALGNVEYACMVETPPQEWQASLAIIRAELERLQAVEKAACDLKRQHFPATLEGASDHA